MSVLGRQGNIGISRFDLKPNSKNPKILDIGCGMNPAPDANVIMDINPDIGREFKDKKFVRHNANDIPFPFKDSTFDYIYLNNVIEHLTCEDGLLFKELKRILKIYGKAEIHCPNSLFIYHRFLYFIGIIPCDFMLCHIKHYSFQQLKHNLRNAGFKIFELNNLWLFNPIKNFIYPHIKIIVKKGS